MGGWRQGAADPVFLLPGIATFLNAFATRLARVGDKVESESPWDGGALTRQRPFCYSTMSAFIPPIKSSTAVRSGAGTL